MRSFLLYFLLAGCSHNPCDGQAGVCIAVRAIGDVEPLDRIELRASLGSRTKSASTVEKPPLRLPVRFAVLLGDASGTVTLELDGISGTESIAQGAATLTVPPSGQEVTVRLVPGTISDAGALDDLAVPDLSQPEDAALADVDLMSSPDLAPGDLATLVKRVFVTSAVFDGMLGGHLGADQRCQDAAAAAGLSGVWMAWISTSISTPAQRFTHANVPYTLIDGTVVANNWTGLTSGALAGMIDLTELGGVPGRNHLSYSGCPGASPGPNTYVWSNTSADGQRDKFSASIFYENCSDFSTTSGATSGRLGSTRATDVAWTTVCMVSPCSATAPLYCFEQ